MDESSAKTSVEIPPDQPEQSDPAEPRDSFDAPPPLEEEAGGGDQNLSPDDKPRSDRFSPEPEPVRGADQGLKDFPYDYAAPAPKPTEAAEAADQAPARSGRRRKILLGLLIILIVLAALAWYLVPEGRDLASETHEETAEMARDLAAVIRAESLDQDRLHRAEKALGARSPQSRPARELALGAAAFLRDELREAHQHFAAAAVLAPDVPDLISFQAAASLRQGNSALAAELYRRALTQKEQSARPPLDLAADQLGLALSLFFLQRPAEALPLAESAWQTRSRELGLATPDSLSAANRLATILVALGRQEVAEELLKAAYRGALAGEEVAAVLEETKLLLTVLHDQSGRMEELEDFFRQDPPAPAPKAKDENGAAPKPEPPAPPLPPATAENLAEWARTAAGLDQASPDLAADLRLRIIQGREVRKGLDRHQPEFRADLLALIRAYLAAGRYDRALEELRPLEEGIGRGTDDFIQYADLLAQGLAGRDLFKEAEAQWQSAADLVDARISAQLKAKKAPVPDDAARSLDLHLKLAEVFLKQGRPPLEAEIELLAALGRLGPQMADKYPDAARVYLRLARLMWEMDRTRDSAGFYGRARKLAEDLAPQAELPQKEFLANIARLAALEAEALAAKQPRPVFIPEMSPAEAEELPSPDILRLELAALAALGRRAEFQDRLEPVLTEAARRYGQSSQYYMRYYSLKLKGLEEEGRIDDLTAELLRQAEQPPGRNEAERALNRGSALIYAARVNEKAGRPTEAIKLYEQALAAISGREESIIAARRRVVEEALERLKGKEKGAF